MVTRMSGLTRTLDRIARLASSTTTMVTLRNERSRAPAVIANKENRATIETTRKSSCASGHRRTCLGIIANSKTQRPVRYARPTVSRNGTDASFRFTESPAAAKRRSARLNCAVDQATHTAHNATRLRLAARNGSDSDRSALGSGGSTAGTSGGRPDGTYEKKYRRKPIPISPPSQRLTSPLNGADRRPFKWLVGDHRHHYLPTFRCFISSKCFFASSTLQPLSSRIFFSQVTCTLGCPQ